MYNIYKEVHYAERVMIKIIESDNNTDYDEKNLFKTNNKLYPSS